MRFISLKLINYIGIYNGLGLDEIFIDFTKCRHSTIIIKGFNGSGKSTVMKSLTPMPDDNSCFRPGFEARKELVMENHGIVYLLKFVHGVKPDGSRNTSKAYISKSIDGKVIELNSNGNVGSFKDVVFSEFSLDPNFLSLSRLGSEDRGIVEKTPSERKRFINSIVNTVEVYNNMNKTLTKRASSFNSMTNRIISKIESIGNEEELLATLTSLENRINKMLVDKDNMIEDLSSHKSTISLIDPSGEIQNKYNEIFESLKVYNKELKTLDEKIESLSNKMEVTPNIEVVFNANTLIRNRIAELDSIIFSSEKEIQNMLLDRETDSTQLERKTSKLKSITEDINMITLEESIKDNENKLNSITSTLSSIGFDLSISLTKDEYILGINTIIDLKEMIGVLKSNEDNRILELSIDEYLNTDIGRELMDISNSIEETRLNILDLELELSKQYEVKKLTGLLSLRPIKCDIDSCPFIRDSIEAFNKNPSKDIDTLENDINESKTYLESLMFKRSDLEKINICTSNINRILRSINNNGSILRKLPNMENVMNSMSILDRIKRNDDFSELDMLLRYVEATDLIEEYNIIKNVLNELYSEYNKYTNRDELIEEISRDLELLQANLSNIEVSIENSRNIILEGKKELSILETRSKSYDSLLELLNAKNSLESEKNIKVTEYYTIQNNIGKIKECEKSIIDLTGKIEELGKTITPIINDRDEINHNIRVLKEYKEELEIYSKKYEIVDVLKKHSNPTKGIQTMYIKLYMNKTLSFTNELVSYLFDGRFSLLPYEIDDSNFKIPCIADGMIRDDISNLSNAEKSMMSMIVSFVLLKQASSDYNIILLDEIDAPLDEYNRITFISLMDRLKSVLNIEQCIMISHSIESNYDNCDLIILKANDSQEFRGNIIYKY